MSYQPMQPMHHTPYEIAPRDPAQGLGITAMILSLVNLVGIPTSLIGLILGHVALRQSKRAGFSNPYALTAVIVGWILVGLSILFLLLIILSTIGAGLAASGAEVSEKIVYSRAG